MPKIVIQVMPKQELLDPQGKAVAGALARLGKGHYGEVRVGKRFELTTDRPLTSELMAEAAEIADELLANGVIEDVIAIDAVEDDDAAADDVDVDGDVDAALPLGAASDAQAHANERDA